jgi:hypothetical protein
MKISGFTMVRNAGKLYYPVKESILSVLPIVHEFVVALGKGDEDDTTRDMILSIGSDKIKIFDRIWHEEDFVKGKVMADETNFALNQCSGDWCFYLQADEVVHEGDLCKIEKACEDYHDNPVVDGLLFRYNHFWGDYDHYLPFHGWYRNEIRVVRNHSNLYSIKDAQSFRKGSNELLSVKEIDARIFHYGWVRPPGRMQSKKNQIDSIYHGTAAIQKISKLLPNEFDYGALGNIPVYKGSHPAVMKEFMQKLDWNEKLNYTREAALNRPKFKHESVKYRLLSFVENTFNSGRDFFGYSNWKKV